MPQASPSSVELRGWGGSRPPGNPEGVAPSLWCCNDSAVALCIWSGQGTISGNWRQGGPFSKGGESKLTQSEPAWQPLTPGSSACVCRLPSTGKRRGGAGYPSPLFEPLPTLPALPSPPSGGPQDPQVRPLPSKCPVRQSPCSRSLLSCLGQRIPETSMDPNSVQAQWQTPGTPR